MLRRRGSTGTAVVYHRGKEDPELECFVMLPMDFPAYMRMLRILSKEAKAERRSQIPVHDHLGTTMELDFITMGVKVYIRHGRDGTLRVIGEDAEGRELLAEWKK